MYKKGNVHGSSVLSVKWWQVYYTFFMYRVCILCDNKHEQNILGFYIYLCFQHILFLRVEIVSDWKLSFIKLIFSLSPSECLLSFAQEGKLPQETRPEFLFLLLCLPKAIKLYFAAFKGSQLSWGSYRHNLLNSTVKYYF